jgi:hypothetical protein
MAPGSIVLYIADPLLYGKMIVLEVVQDGRLLCESIHTDREGQYARELFDSHELELAERWQLPQVTQTGLPGKP